MSARLSVVMCVYNQLELTRACLDSLRASAEPFRLVVVDNGSSDDTRGLFERWAYPWPLDFDRNATNQSVLATYNRAWRRATTDLVCLLHNDTEMLDPSWIARLATPLGTADVGLAGLYGVKRVRRDGRYVGRTIVHSLAQGPTVRPPWEEVAIVDGVCLALRRAVLEELGGLDEGYGFYHGYDKDLSFAVRERGRRCVVVRAPFRHHGGGTRATDARDLAARRAGWARFADKWRHRLPCDVRPRGARVGEWLGARLGLGRP